MQRYRHFEKAFLDNELDTGFKDLSVWGYRMVVNGEEPDEILTWGGKIFRNYRPDHISTPDRHWRLYQPLFPFPNRIFLHSC